MVNKIKVGIIGTGNISPAYITGCRAFEVLDLVACADLDMDKARQAAQTHAIPQVYSVDELLADPSIDVVINLTIPATHAAVSLQIIDAGKHVYSEKPLATTRADGQKILAAAQAKGVLVGCAPDTFLFGTHQTVRHLIDDGCIGQPVAAVAFMLSNGPERWHPNPDFFYQPGGGPLLDMGPYYITCLVNLLGAVKRVSGVTRISMPERTAKDGHTIPVKVATHVTGSLEFESGAVATLINSFDVWAHHLPKMEIYGTAGSMRVPDPNGYDSQIQLFQPAKNEWEEMSLTHPAEWARGIGVADLAYTLLSANPADRPHRASGQLAYHVLDVMHAFEESMVSGRHVDIASNVVRPTALPTGLPLRELD